ncbi:MAG: RNA polymerase subunit sigma-24 [Candidatus Limiplasma sp.]|nr:RNA polymerase subunit sigma-24 [Candidatus Limiplasma sp.]
MRAAVVAMARDAGGKMTRQRLEQYRALDREIRMLDERLRSTALVSDSVRGSDAEPPYTEHAITITGVDQAALHRLERKRIRARMEQRAIERFIDSIEDSLTRTILEERYIRGGSWAQVATTVGGTNSSDGVRMIARRYLHWVIGPGEKS